MNKNKFLIFVAAFAATVSASAQQATTSAASGSSNGLLGQRYVDVGLAVTDFRNSTLDNGYSGSVAVNLPLTVNLDAAFGYGYERITDKSLGFEIKGTGHTIAARLAAYTQFAGVKPFADAVLGYSWVEASALGIKVDEDDGIYALGAGVEIPFEPSMTLTARVGFSDSFDGDTSGAWTLSLGLDRWFTNKFGAGIGVAFQEDEAVTFGLSARFRF